MWLGAGSQGGRGSTIGRENAQDAIELLLGAIASGRASVAVLRGPAGIGKTHLLGDAIESAEHHGVTVLQSSGHAAAGATPYAGLADLLDGVELRALDLPDVQRDALEMVLRLRAPSDAPTGDPATVHAATRSALAELSKGQPLLIAIDDLHWLDAPTCDALLFALPRLQTARRAAGCIATWRTGEGLDALIDTLLTDTRADDLLLEPLSDAAIAAIVFDVAPTLEASEVARLTERSGGVPLFAVELARHASHATDAALPASVDASFGHRLRRLTPNALDAIGLAALSVQPTVATLAACLGLDAAERSLDELTDADLATRSGIHVRLRHPLVGPAALGRLSTADQRRLRLLLCPVAPTRSECAVHMVALHAAPHAATADVLVEAMHESIRLSAPREAAAFARNALTFTPPESPFYGSRVIAAVRQLVGMRLVDDLEALLDGVRPPTDPVVGGWLQWGRGSVSYMRREVQQAVDAFELVRSITDDAEVVHRTLVDQSFMLLQLVQTDRALTAASLAVAVSEKLPGGLRSEAISMEVGIQAILGLPWSQERLDEAMALEQTDSGAQPTLRASGTAAILAIFADDHPRAEAHLLRMAERGEATGAVGDQNWTSLFLTYARFRLGTLVPVRGADLDAAGLDDGVYNRSFAELYGKYPRSDGSEEPTGDLGGDFAQLMSGQQPLGSLASLMATATTASPLTVIMTLTLFAGLFVGEQRYEELLTVEPMFWFVKSQELLEPILLTWGTDLVEANLALGKVSETVALIAAMRAMTDGAPRRSIAAALARVEALRCAATGDMSAAAQHASTSVDSFAELAWPIEHGRSLLVRARVAHQNRRYRAAFDDATLATERFRAANCGLWEKVGAAAAARYKRQRTVGNDRTATQERIAELVREGLSNRDIATRMSVSVKTVEMHLTEVYRRAGVVGRREFQAIPVDRSAGQV